MIIRHNQKTTTLLFHCGSLLIWENVDFYMTFQQDQSDNIQQRLLSMGKKTLKYSADSGSPKEAGNLS